MQQVYQRKQEEKEEKRKGEDELNLVEETLLLALEN